LRVRGLGLELERLFLELAERVKDFNATNLAGESKKLYIRDINGNTVGNLLVHIGD
jgi:hypothetical protein